jgi:hypothetical protein
MTTTENQEAILRRIAKLLAIAQDDRANPEEAAAAAGMAERIMRKYQIENADVIVASLKAGNDMETADSVATAKTNGTKVERTPPWAQWLAVAIAGLNNTGARNTLMADGQAGIRFYGFKADVQVAKFMFDYLVATTNRLCVQYRSSVEYQIGGRRVMNSYRQGVSMGILAAVRKQTQAKTAEAQTSSSGTSLMVVKQQAIAERFGSVFKTKTGKSSVSRGDSFAKGYVDGRSVDVNRRGVGHDGGSSHLRLQ